MKLRNFWKRKEMKKICDLEKEQKEKYNQKEREKVNIFDSNSLQSQYNDIENEKSIKQLKEINEKQEKQHKIETEELLKKHKKEINDLENNHQEKINLELKKQKKE